MLTVTVSSLGHERIETGTQRSEIKRKAKIEASFIHLHLSYIYTSTHLAGAVAAAVAVAAAAVAVAATATAAAAVTGETDRYTYGRELNGTLPLEALKSRNEALGD